MSNDKQVKRVEYGCCPVCNGKGIVFGTGISTSITETCYHCNGSKTVVSATEYFPLNPTTDTPELKDWEIMDMKHYEDNSIHPFIEKTCFNPSHPPCSIHSVKRLSDGVVFSVGCEWDNCKITSFEIINGDMVVNFSNDVDSLDLQFCSNPKHRPTPTEQKSDVLFTTSDGQPVFDGSKYYAVFEFEIIVCQADVAGKKFTAEWLKMCKDTNTFSTKEAAEQFIIDNKPCLSLKEVVDRSIYGGRKIPIENPHYQSLLELVKQKLNKQINQ